MRKHGRKAASAALSMILATTLVLTGVSLAVAADEPSDQSQANGASKGAVVEPDARTTEGVDGASQADSGKTGVQKQSAPEADAASSEAAQITGDLALVQEKPKATIGSVRSGGLVYTVNVDGVTVTLSGWYGSAPAGNIVIPSLVVSGDDSFTVSAIDSSSDEGVLFGASATSITLPSTIDRIADGALSGCVSLTRILVDADNESFSSYDGMLFDKELAKLVAVPDGKKGTARIPDETVEVVPSAFASCVQLVRIEVGDGNAAFSSVDDLLCSKAGDAVIACAPGAGEAVVLSADVEAIEAHAFSGCDDLASITALGFVRSIDDDSFSGAVKTSAVVALPAGDDYDERKAVWEAAGFSRFLEPAKPGDVAGPSAPDGESDDVEASGLSYTLLDDYTLAVSWQGAGDAQADLVIPSSAEVGGVAYRVSTIARAGFTGMTSIRSVTLPAGTTSIGEAAFAGCTNLASAALPEDLRDVGDRAFEACKLADAWLPAGVESVGSRAFADCGSLARVVALGVPDVAADALAGCTGATVYCPFDADGAYPWNVGLPVAGNHLMPYGIELAAETLSLEAGQDADLLEGGLVEAPEPIETSWSYAAAPVSVDAGRVTGKTAGSSEVAAVLSLDGVELARASRTVEVSPGAEQEADEDIPMVNETVTLLPSMYMATGARAAAEQLNVTAPVAVTFGDGNGYDVANPSASVTSTAYFKNGSTTSSARMVGLTCTENGVKNVIEPVSGSLDTQKLFSLYPGSDEAKAVSFGFGTSVNTAAPTAGTFDIKKGESLGFTYRLNLTNNTTLANAKVKASAADNGMSVKSLANVAYTFELVTEGQGSESDDFYLKDNTTGLVYSTSEVKAHANDIAKNGSNSSYYAMYNGFLKETRSYTCKTKWGGVSYDVRIIDINHDELVTAADGRTKAGLTFQFVNLLNNTRMNATNVNAGGWGSSELRASMNSGAIWTSVPTDLQGVIAPVKKYYTTESSASASVTTSSDKLFIASYSELVATSTWASSYPWTSKEGTQYAYWNGKVTANAGANPLLVKGLQSSPTSAAYWWERSVDPNNSSNFLNVNTNGNPTNNNSASNSYGVCPCFCL